jgi:D-tyrosyl-tRNA(Tyr) deacylase
VAEPLVEELCAALRRRGAHVETGIFGAHMDVESVNNGPVTVILDVGQTPNR